MVLASVVVGGAVAFVVVFGVGVGAGSISSSSGTAVVGLMNVLCPDVDGLSSLLGTGVVVICVFCWFLFVLTFFVRIRAPPVAPSISISSSSLVANRSNGLLINISG